MTSSFDSALSPPLSGLSEMGVGWGPSLALELQHSGSPPATDGPRCRSPQRQLTSCVPGAAALGDPSLTRPRGACQAAVVQRGKPETHRKARRETERTGETHAQREHTVVKRNSERQERWIQGSRRHGSGGHGRGASRTHTRARTPTHTRYTRPHTPCASVAPIPSNKAELQPLRREPERVGTSLILAGRGRVICFLGPIVANLLLPLGHCAQP